MESVASPATTGWRGFELRTLVIPLLVLSAMLVYTIAVSAEAVYGHVTFRSPFDTAIYDQRLWLFSTGRAGFSTIVAKPFLGDHFEPALMLLTPLYWVGLDVPGILVMQTIGIAAVSPALYVLAREVGASRGLAAIPALLWLAAPATASANLFGFRPASFAPLMLVVSVIALRRGRVVLLAVSTLVALSLKEDIALTYVVLAVLAAIEGRRRIAALLVAASIVCLAISSMTIRSLSGQYDWQFVRFAGDRADSPYELLVYFGTNPIETLETVVRNGGLVVAMLVVATGGLCFFAARWMLLGLPTILFNSLSAYGSQHELAHHYHAIAAVSFFIAAAVGAHRIALLPSVWRVAATCGVVAAVAIGVVTIPASHLDSPRLGAQERVNLRAALDALPDRAPVAVTPDLAAYLSQREEIYTYPEPFVRLDWGASLSVAEYARRARHVRFVVIGLDKPVEYAGDLSVVRDRLEARGWTRRALVGAVEILERR